MTVTRSSSSPLQSPPGSQPFNPQTYLAAAKQKFASTPPSLIPDVLSPTPSRLLTLSLADHIPSLFPTPTPSPPSSHDDNESPILPQGHHLVYFPPQLPPSKLLPDGTDPAHSPGGPPFVRRMWAGGEVVFHDGWERRFRVDGRPVVCVETVVPESVVLKGGAAAGVGNNEKVFVDVRREYGLAAGGGGGGWGGRERDGLVMGEGGAVVSEVRRLVFLRDQEKVADMEREREKERPRRGVKVPYTPEFTYPLRPDAILLFHFSALTYNAHAIHLNPEYARGVEGHRGLLVHGPLSLVLMLAALRASLIQIQLQSSSSAKIAAQSAGWVPMTKSINYSNLAPLYVDEEMRVCLRRATKPPDWPDLRWDVWVEGPEGRLAVKATAVTTGSTP